MTTVHQRGYSVLELLIVLSLAVIVIVAAGQLVAESVQLFDAVGRGVRNPSLTLATATLRNDLHEAGAIIGPPPIGWTDRPLELAASDGRRMRVTLERDELVRETCDPLGRPTARRVLARGITSWWWRLANPQTVDIRVTALASAGSGRPERGQIQRRTEIRRFVVRGAPGGRSW